MATKVDRLYQATVPVRIEIELGQLISRRREEFELLGGDCRGLLQALAAQISMVFHDISCNFRLNMLPNDQFPFRTASFQGAVGI